MFNEKKICRFIEQMNGVIAKRPDLNWAFSIRMILNLISTAAAENSERTYFFAMKIALRLLWIWYNFFYFYFLNGHNFYAGVWFIDSYNVRKKNIAHRCDQYCYVHSVSISYRFVYEIIRVVHIHLLYLCRALHRNKNIKNNKKS